MKNFNETIERMKSLFTEERMFGNLVEDIETYEGGLKVTNLNPLNQVVVLVVTVGEIVVENLISTEPMVDLKLLYLGVIVIFLFLMTDLLQGI